MSSEATKLSPELSEDLPFDEQEVLNGAAQYDDELRAQQLACLRDKFAELAMRVLITVPISREECHGHPVEVQVARMAYNIAEAMLAERKRRNPDGSLLQ